MKKVLTSLFVIAIFLINGCGGGSSTVTGQFVDTYVEGLNYTCSSGRTGVTNNMGEYTCNTGDTVEFSVGNYVLGSATASSGVITPSTLYPDNAKTALNVAQLIQSLDTDPSDDIITIPEDFTTLDNVTIRLHDANFDALMEDILNIPLVTEEQAQTHLDETILFHFLAGKTFYELGNDYLDEVIYNENLTSGTWITLEGFGIEETGIDALSLEGKKLKNDGNGYIVFVKETEDYLLFNHFNENDELEGEKRLYYDKVKAQKAYGRTLYALIVGKTKYFANSQGIIGYRHYAEDGTYTGSITLTDGTTVDVSGTYKIVKNVLTLNRTSPAEVILVLTYIGEEAGGLAFTISVDGGEESFSVLFDTAEERDAYVASLQPDLEALFVGKTKYFATSIGGIGYRSYATDGNYTGSLLFNDVVYELNGTYEIETYVMTLNRTSPNVTTLTLTYAGEEAGGVVFNTISPVINGGEEFQTITFDTEEERDAYVAGSLSMTFENNTVVNIIDDGIGGAATTSVIDVSNATTSISKVTITLDITHTWISDLIIRLMSPSGSSIILSNVNIPYAINYTNTTFDDDAAISILDEDENISGIYRPVETLSLFNGENSNGTWTLEVHDEVIADGGTLNSWSITIE